MMDFPFLCAKNMKDFRGLNASKDEWISHKIRGLQARLNLFNHQQNYCPWHCVPISGLKLVQHVLGDVKSRGSLASTSKLHGTSDDKTKFKIKGAATTMQRCAEALWLPALDSMIKLLCLAVKPITFPNW
jgi:hypothetical protein